VKCETNNRSSGGTLDDLESSWVYHACRWH